MYFFFNDTATTEIYTLSLHDALPILSNYIIEVVNSDMNFFSSMLPKRKLGQIITVSAKEKDDISRAEKFLSLIGE